MIANLSKVVREFRMRGAMRAARSDTNPRVVAEHLRVREAYFPCLLIEAGLVAHEKGNGALAQDLLSQAVAHPTFLQIHNDWRRRVALTLVALGDLAASRSIFVNLSSPAVATLDDATGDKASEDLTRAVIEHVQLATILGQPV